MALRARISVPPTARRDEVVTIKTLVAHPMETGFRRDASGRSIPRDILTRFECHFDDGAGDVLVFAADLHPAVAANPFLRFHLRATRSGTLRFRWYDAEGLAAEETRPLTVDD